MIFYFSGTGNSLYAAKYIAEKQGLEVINIAEKMQTKQLIFVPKDGETIGFVFPVYAWAPPKIVLDFIDKIQLARKNNYIFAVCTCGANVGNSMEILRGRLNRSGIPLNSDFSVTMPDNYIVSYDVCSEEQQQIILKKADEKLDHIDKIISKKQNASESEKGRFSALKSSIVNPMFNKHMTNARKFYSTESCNSCGFCAKICPQKNIAIVDGKPVWSEDCSCCLACIHRCPKRAIQFGKSTVKRGRYYNPNCDKIDA